MKTGIVVIGALVVCTLFASGCAYRYYLGMHGPSILQHPAVHQNVKEDSECLACHHPDHNPKGPPTTHPGFTGCYTCHSDAV
jgi:hypothetical protein